MAYAITGISLAWCAWIVLHAHLGRFDTYKPAVYILAPILFYLLVAYLDELLAARSLGGLLLLAANPMLYASRLWDGQSPLRLVIPLLAYAIILVGIILVMSPYRFRHWIETLARTDGRCRVASGAFILVGAGVLALGHFVY
jgi:hypothetical protein